MIPRPYLSPVLLASVVVIATSGLIYEFIAATVASYVLGDSVTQFSFVIGLYLSAMGIGSYLSRFIDRHILQRFVEIELSIAIIGGVSAPLLFAVYTIEGAFRWALYGLVLAIGTLAGLEIPLLIRLLKFRLDLKELVARVLSLDYIGALFASLLFPLVLLPRLGIHRTSLAVGILNALVAFLATFFIPVQRQVVWRLRAQASLIIMVLFLGIVFADRGVVAAESYYFGASVIYHKQTPYQRIVITQSKNTTRLFLNGNLQFSSDDEARYHEVLVHPAVAALGRDPRRVLVLGGGDGLAVRELLRYPSIEAITLVDLDGAVTKVFSTLPAALAINKNALNDDRVIIINQDGFAFLKESTESFDLAVVDFPDPSNYALGKLYTLSFYRRLRERVGVRGVVVVQATSPYYARQSFWTVVNTMEQAGFKTAPLHVYVPSFGEWGFVLAGGPMLGVPTALRIEAQKLQFLERQGLPELFRFPNDMSRVKTPIQRLNDQKLVTTYMNEWANATP